MQFKRIITDSKTNVYYVHSIKIMKFVGNTVSKPVAGKEAKILSKALKKGSYVANEQAIATIQRIAERRGKSFVPNGSK